MLPQALGVLHDFPASRPVCLRDRFEDPQETWPVVSIFGRKVCASKNRLAIRQEKDGQRPAAAARHHLNGAHIDLVEVRPFLSVDLDVNEVLVHDLRDRRVLEGLVFHHMAPVTGGVSDAQQDQLVFFRRALQRLCTPGIPIHRIMSVLQKIRTSFVDEPVGHVASALRLATRSLWTNAKRARLRDRL